jgi:hypothetical protein
MDFVRLCSSMVHFIVIEDAQAPIVRCRTSSAGKSGGRRGKWYGAE